MEKYELPKEYRDASLKEIVELQKKELAGMTAENVNIERIHAMLFLLHCAIDGSGGVKIPVREEEELLRIAKESEDIVKQGGERYTMEEAETELEKAWVNEHGGAAKLFKKYYDAIDSEKMEKIFGRLPDPAINIIIEESGTSADVHFVEIEDDNGKSINIGERIKRDDAFTSIRIKLSDMALVNRNERDET